MTSKLIKIFASVAMLFGSSGATVYAEPTAEPTATPTVSESTPTASGDPASTAEASATPTASAEATAEAIATPSATPTATAEASADPTTGTTSDWLSDWSYTVDDDTSTVILSQYLPEPSTTDDGSLDSNWSVDVTVPATAEVDSKQYNVALASQISTASTMVPVHSISFEDGVKLQVNSDNLFTNFHVSMIHAGGLDLTGVTSMDYAFSGTSLRTLDLSGLDFSGIADVSKLVVNDNWDSSYIVAPAKFAEGATCPLPTYGRGTDVTEASPISFYAMDDDGTVDESVEYTDLAAAPANTKLVRRMPVVLWIGGTTLDSYNTAMASATDASDAYNAFNASMGTDIPAGVYRFGLYNNADRSTDLGDPVETMEITIADDGTASYTLTRDGVTSETKDCELRLTGSDYEKLPRFERHYDSDYSVVLMLDADGNPMTDHLASYSENGNFIYFVNPYATYGKISGISGFDEDDRGQTEYGSVIGIANKPDTAATITFDPGYDGSTAVTESTVQGTEISLYDHAIERDGYMLLGWSDGTNKYSFNGKYTVPSDMHAVTLTAIWQEIKAGTTIAVDYKADGGNKGSTILSLSLDLNGEAMTADDGGILPGADSTRATKHIIVSAYGTQTYTITPGTPNLVDYALDSSDTHTVTMTVSHDETSPLIATVAIDGGKPKTVQTVTVGSQDGKLLIASSSGSAIVAGTYTLSLQDPLPAEDKLSVIVNEDGSPKSGASIVVDDKNVKATGDDGTAVYDVTHASEGTVSYTVRQNLTAEQKADKNVQYDETVYTVTYTTHRESADETAAEHRNLTSDVVITTDAGYVTDKVVFNNYTVPADASDVAINGTVVFDNEFRKVDSFPFELLDEHGDQIEKVDSIDGGIKFSDLHFDAEGTHTYTVRQIVGNDPTIKYDDAEYVLTVTTKLSKINGKNTYVSTVKMKKDGKDTDKIAFVNESIPANPLAVSESARGDDGMVILFNDAERKIKNGVADNTKTFDDAGTYTTIVKQDLSDDQLADKNWDYDTSVYTITYTVTRTDNDLSETHVIKDAYGNVYDEIVFHNTHNDPTASSTVLSGTVTIDNDNRTAQGLDEIDAFTIELVDENGKVVQSIESRNGKFEFAPLSYSAEGTHTLKIRQKAGNDPTVDYSDTIYTVTIDTKLNANAPDLDAYVDTVSIKATADGKANRATTIAFTNKTLDPNPVSFRMEGIVTKNGNVPSVEKYSFIASHGKSETAVESKADLVDFGDMKVTVPGTYTFKLYQKAGKVSSIAYDATIYTAKVAVTRNVNDLEYKITYTDDHDNSVDYPKWNNVTAKAFAAIEPLDVSSYLAGKVTLNDALPTCPCFDFTLSESNTRTVAKVTGNGMNYSDWSDEIDPNEIESLGGKITKTSSAYRKDSVVSAVKNNNGTFSFSGITVDHEGEYTFTIREVKGNNSNLNYDTSDVYVITLNVSRDWKTGKLVVDSSEVRKNGNIVKATDVIFANTTKTAYQASKDSKSAPTASPTASATVAPTASPSANATASDNPQSGAEGYLGYIPGAIIAAAGVVILLVVKRKANKA